MKAENDIEPNSAEGPAVEREAFMSASDALKDIKILLNGMPFRLTDSIIYIDPHQT